MTAKPYDPALKTLVETEPGAWPALLGRPQGPTTVIDADIATVSGAADKVLRVAAHVPYLLHLEFVAGHDSATLPRKLHLRNALLEERHDLGVVSVAVLLRPEADSPQLTGVYKRGFPGEKPYPTFRYPVVRVWQLSPESFLSGGVGLLPLAPISAVTEAQLPGIIQRMEQRLRGRRAQKQAPVVWSAAYLLLGLRYTPALAAQLFRGIVTMKESSTYQAILAEEARKVLRLQGDDAFGPPDTATATAIERLEDVAQLEALLKKMRTATNWQQLLGQPAPRRRGGRRQSS